MTDQVGFRPTPGRDAMTRDGRRVTNLRGLADFDQWALSGSMEGGHERWWRADGSWSPHDCMPHPLDLVADWPDADPLPDADGWEPKVGDRVKLVKDGLSTVGAVGMEGVIKKIEGGQHPYLIELDEGLVYESYAVPEQYRLTRADRDYFVSAVRPAPSGPVVEETVKRIVPIGSDEWADQAERLEWAYIAGIMRELAGQVQPPLPSYIRPAIDIAEARATEGWRTFRARQIGEAMEGK